MSLKETLEREKNVVLYGQTARFRIVKYIVIVILALIIYAWKGWNAVGLSLVAGTAAGVCVHFVFRYLTAGWMKSWGPYKHDAFDMR